MRHVWASMLWVPLPNVGVTSHLSQFQFKIKYIKMHFLTGTTTFQVRYSHKWPVATVLNGVDMGQSPLSFAGHSVGQCCLTCGAGWALAGQEMCLPGVYTADVLLLKVAIFSTAAMTDCPAVSGLDQHTCGLTAL